MRPCTARPTWRNSTRRIGPTRRTLDAQDYDSAVQDAERAYEIGKELFGAGSKELPMLAFNYGTLLVVTQHDQLARTIVGETLTLYESAYGEKSPETIETLMQLGVVAGDRNDVRSNRQFIDQALAIAAKQFGPKSVDYALLQHRAGSELLYGTGSPNGRKYLQDAYGILQERLGDEDARTAAVDLDLGYLYLSDKKPEKAEKYLSLAVATFADFDHPANVSERQAHNLMIQTYAQLGEPDRMIRHCRAFRNAGSGDASASKILPVAVVRFAPVYPAEALFAHAEGYVDFRFTVDERSAVREPEVLSVVGHKSLEDAALKAITRFRYCPAIEDGKPTATTGVKTRISFQIED